jgi:DNA polymerase/3'-5' exonuclease PolX
MAIQTNSFRSSISDHFIQYGDEVQRGPVKSKIQIRKYGVAVQCDLWIVNEWQWGSALNYATGNKWHNIMLRQLCAERNWRLNEYGVYEAGNISTSKFLELADNNELDYRNHGALERHGDGSYVASRLGGTNERDVYSLLGMDWVEPEDREQNEEEARNYIQTSKIVNS